MAAVTAILSVVSGVIGAVGAIQSANAQAAASEYNAQIQERNSKISEQNRKFNVDTARIASEDKARENRRTLASMRAAYGASGLDLAGSPLEVLADASTEMALDERRVAYEGYTRNRDSQIEQIGYGEQATLNRMEGKAAKTSGYITALGYLTKAGLSVMENRPKPSYA